MPFRFFKIVLPVMLCFMIADAEAQYSKTIRTGRPGQSLGPFTVGKNVIQTQTGIESGKDIRSDKNTTMRYVSASTGWRIGITERIEINTGWAYRFDRTRAGASDSKNNGLSLSSIGSRMNLYKGRKHIPAIGLQLSLRLPILSPAYDFKYIAPRIVLIAREKITKKLGVLVNTAMNYNGKDMKPIGAYTVNMQYSLSSKWGTFVENYGQIANHKLESRWDTGLYYLCNDNLQIDAFGGGGWNNNKRDYFASVGISWRLTAFHHPEINSIP